MSDGQKKSVASTIAYAAQTLCHAIMATTAASLGPAGLGRTAVPLPLRFASLPPDSMSGCTYSACATGTWTGVAKATPATCSALVTEGVCDRKCSVGGTASVGRVYVFGEAEFT